MPNNPRRRPVDVDIDLAPDEATTFGNDDITLETDETPADETIPTLAEAEEAMVGEVSQVLVGFKAAARREAQRYEDATDSEFWFTLCFQTREQSEEFLQKIGWGGLGDKYLDGMACARVLGITLESRIPALPNLTLDRRYLPLALPEKRR